MIHQLTIWLWKADFKYNLNKVQPRIWTALLNYINTIFVLIVTKQHLSTTNNILTNIKKIVNTLQNHKHLLAYYALRTTKHPWTEYKYWDYNYICIILLLVSVVCTRVLSSTTTQNISNNILWTHNRQKEKRI